MLRTSKSSIVWLIVMFSSVVLLIVGVSQAKMIEVQGKKYDIAQPGEFKPGEIVIKGHPETSKEAVQGLAAQLSAKVKAHIPEYNLYLLVMPPRAGEASQKAQVEEAVQTLKRFPQVRAAYPNYKMSIPRPPEAPLGKDGAKGSSRVPGTGPNQELTPQVSATALGLANYQWHLDKVKFRNAGAAPSSAPMVAVIDTGVDYDHPDLAANVVQGKDFIENDDDPMDEAGHGTHVAGLIAANGAGSGSGITGISPTSKILAVRVLDQYGAGTWFQVMQGIVYAKNSTAKILNLSLGGYFSEGSSSYLDFKQAVDDCVTAGKIVCVAAGNENNFDSFYDIHNNSPPNLVPVPAWFPNSFTTAASEQNDCRSYFSNYDVGTLSGVAYNFSFVDLVAPGWKIFSTIPISQGGYAVWSGTSMATPIIAGCAARVWAKYPSYTRAQVENRLISTGVAVGNTSGANGFYAQERRVDLMKALGLSATGFTGVVYNGQTGAPLAGAKVVATPSGLTATTNAGGFFTLTGLTGGTTYSLAFSKTGFSNYNLTGQKATANKLKDLIMPTHLNKVRGSSEWSILFSHHNWHPGYRDAIGSFWYYWWPVPWNTAAGLFFDACLDMDGTNVINWYDMGNLIEPPYAALTNDGWVYTSGSQNIVISQLQSGSTYRIYAYLNNNDPYEPFEWGDYKGPGQGLEVRIYQGATLKHTVVAASATGSGAYWWVADLQDGVITIQNKMGTSVPPF
jgi:hypothetical protein